MDKIGEQKRAEAMSLMGSKLHPIGLDQFTSGTFQLNGNGRGRDWCTQVTRPYYVEGDNLAEAMRTNVPPASGPHYCSSAGPAP